MPRKLKWNTKIKEAYICFDGFSYLHKNIPLKQRKITEIYITHPTYLLQKVATQEEQKEEEQTAIN